MLRKLLLAPLVLSLASLLMVTDVAQAQRRGGRVAVARGYRGGINRGYGGRYYAGYRAYPYRNYYGYGLGYGGLGYGLGYGGFGYGGLGYGGLGYGGYGGYPGYYSYPGYSSYPGSSYGYPISSSNAYATNAATTVDQTANVRVIVPDPNAQVWFDGTKTQQTGTDRSFHTPMLEAGAANQYHIRASWMKDGHPVVQERDIHVEPGQDTLVDFMHAN